MVVPVALCRGIVGGSNADEEPQLVSLRLRGMT